MTPPDRGGTRALHLALGVAITAALVWWAFHKVDFAEVWTHIRTVHPGAMALAVALATVPFALRVPRWRLLLRHDDDTPLPVAPLWHAVAIGFAANNVLPFRAGEVLRVGAVSRLASVSFAAALSSVAVERVIDALAVVALMGAGLVAAQVPNSVTVGGNAQRIGIICLAALLAALLAAWRRDFAVQVVRRVSPAGRFGDATVRFVDRLLSGLSALRDPRRALPVAGWSLAIWLINAAAFSVAFKAFRFPIPFAGALVLQGVLTMGIAVPSTPGYAFVFEAAIVAALALYGIDKDAAFAYAVTFHITTFVPITALGAWSAIHTGTRLRAPVSAP